MSFGADWTCFCGWANLDVRKRCRSCGQDNPENPPAPPEKDRATSEVMNEPEHVYRGVTPDQLQAVISSENSKFAGRIHVALNAATPSAAVRDVLAECRRQVDVKGWTPEHDDSHDKGEMARAAISYATAAVWPDRVEQKVMQEHGWSGTPHKLQILWPWDGEWWKPGPARRMLVKAAALVIKEIERIDRKEQR